MSSDVDNFTLARNYNISIHKVWCYMMYSITTCHILLHLLYWRMMRNVLIFSCYCHSSLLFSLLIIMRHMRLVQFWCTNELSLYFQYQVWCVVYNLLLSSSRRAMLSEDEKCNTMSIYNHSSSMFPSALVGSQVMGLVRFLHDVLKDNIYFWMCT